MNMKTNMNTPSMNRRDFLQKAGRGIAGIVTAGILNNVEVAPEKRKEQLTEPPYIFGYMKPGNCAGYARRATRGAFGWEYDGADAWNLRYAHATIDCAGLGEEEIFQQVKPGFLLGIYYPNSRENSTPENHKVDARGNLRKYTHAVMYNGGNSEGKRTILHNFGGPRIDELDAFLKQYHCVIKEVILPKHWRSSRAP